jgi:hypothetical protein
MDCEGKKHSVSIAAGKTMLAYEVGMCHAHSGACHDHLRLRQNGALLDGGRAAIRARCAPVTARVQRHHVCRDGSWENRGNEVAAMSRLTRRCAVELNA